ncbi:MAG TPA: DNA polymerase III subunit delta' [Allosphingosinicella sp.]|nr:DNA polymerase III subunit delta' [Allosphingosinicella sp.]
MTALFGHEEAIAAFRDALDSGRLHHAWLVSGPEGIGKATFAAKAALRVLAQGQGPLDAPRLEVPDDHPAARLVAAGSHPDLMRLERRERENSTSGELARNVTVDQVRGLQRLFGTTASMSAWRVVIIDAIDDLERNAANALLKNLEEPPPSSVFLLISHAPERLLPTIRSRCRSLRLSALDDDAMAAALRTVLPDLDETELASLAAAAGGSPGRALAFRGLDIAGLDRKISELVRLGDATNARRSALAQSLCGKAAQPRYEAFLARAPSVIAAEARTRRGVELAAALATWERAQGLASSARGLSLDPESVVFELGGMLASLAGGPDERRSR